MDISPETEVWKDPVAQNFEHVCYIHSQKSEQNFNLFLKIMEQYAVTDLSELPRLKEVMEANGDGDLAWQLHVATINPQVIRPIWYNARDQYRVQEQGKTLQEFLDRYVSLHGVEEEFDLDTNKTIMSLAESKLALQHFQKSKRLDPGRFLRELHQIFNRDGSNTKCNSLVYTVAAMRANRGFWSPFRGLAKIMPSSAASHPTNRSSNGWAFLAADGYCLTKWP